MCRLWYIKRKKNMQGFMFGFIQSTTQKNSIDESYIR